MIRKLTSVLCLALAFWRVQLASAQCVADNVYFDLQSSASQAAVRLTGHSLVPVPANGLNYALLNEHDLSIIDSGVFGPGSSAFNGVLSNLAQGKWLFLAVWGDGSGINAQTVQTLKNQFGASDGVGNLEPGQGYVLVAQKGANSALLEQIAAFNTETEQFDPVVTRVCAANLLGCPVSEDLTTQVLMARSGGTVENGHDADVVIGGHYEWAKCEEDGLCVFVIKSNLEARFPQNGSIAFTDANKFITFIEQPSIQDSDYLVLAVDTDASAILHNADAQAALSRWPASVSSYPTGASYLFIGRASDPGPIAEYTSTDASVISLQCLNAQTGPVNPPGPTPAPSPTPEPTPAPTGNGTAAPSPGPTPEPTVVVLVDIDIHLHIEGENLTLETTHEFTFQKAIVETIVVAVETLTGVDLNVSDFEIVNLTFHYPEDEHTHALRALNRRRLQSTSLDGLLNMLTPADIYEEIADALEQIFDQDLAEIFNSLVESDMTLSSFKVVDVEAEPVNPPAGDDDGDDADDGGDNDGGKKKKKKKNSSSSDDAADWVSSTTGIVVIAVCGAVVVGAILGGIFYGTRQRSSGGQSRRSQRPGASPSDQQQQQQSNAASTAAAATAAEEGKKPE